MYNYITHKEKPKQRYHRFHTISIYTVEINVDKDNPKNELFFNKDGEIRMGNLYQYGQFWVDYSDIWLKIESDFEDNQVFTRRLIQSMVGEVFNIRPLPTSIINESFVNEVGEVFNIRPFTSTYYNRNCGN